jgi:hypothetical protein
MELINNSLYSNQYLKAYYQFEDNANDSKNGHNGTASNVTYLTGKYGKAGSFNGSNSAITIPDHNDLKPTGAFSVGCWVKTTQNEADRRLFSSCNWSGGNLGGIELCVSSGKPGLISMDGSGTTENVDYKKLIGSVSVNDDNWHLIVGTWDGSKLNIYVDLNAPNSVDWNKSAGYLSPNFVTIGRRTTSSGGSANYFNGLIDDLSLINGYAMTGGDVMSLYKEKARCGLAIGSPWIFLKEAYNRHKKLWTQKGLTLPKDLGFSY